MEIERAESERKKNYKADDAKKNVIKVSNHIPCKAIEVEKLRNSQCERDSFNINKKKFPNSRAKEIYFRKTYDKYQ